MELIGKTQVQSMKLLPSVAFGTAQKGAASGKKHAKGKERHWPLTSAFFVSVELIRAAPESGPALIVARLGLRHRLGTCIRPVNSRTAGDECFPRAVGAGLCARHVDVASKDRTGVQLTETN
jgi:hypothetical protein